MTECNAMQSPTIGALAKALAVAQGQIEGAKKDSTNPHFRSSYADLASVWEACRGPLSANGLAVVQTTEVSDKQGVTIVTTLVHASGEWIRGRLHMPNAKGDAQGAGSAITYGRRYGLAAIVGIAPEDDDGEAAQGRHGERAVHSARSSAPPKPTKQAAPNVVVLDEEVPSVTRAEVMRRIESARQESELKQIKDAAGKLPADDVADVRLAYAAKLRELRAQDGRQPAMGIA